MNNIKKYVFARNEDDISLLSEYCSPIIKVLSNKIIQPKEIDLGDKTLLEWFENNPTELTYTFEPFSLDSESITKYYYNPDWKLIEIPLDKREEYCISENLNIQHNKTQFHNDKRQLNLLVKKLNEIFNFIEPNKENKNVFGLELRNSILLSSMEVEIHWNRLLIKNGYKKARYSTKDYIKLSEFSDFDFHFQLINNKDFTVIKPFENWNPSQPTKSLDWYDSYNKIKHNRSKYLHLATLNTALKAITALFTLLGIRYNFNFIENLDNQIIGIKKGTNISRYGFHGGTVSPEVKYIKYFDK